MRSVFRSVLLAVALSLLLAASPTHAVVYKCATGQGVVYQDAACPPGTELASLDQAAATLSVVPGTPAPRMTKRTRPPPAARAATIRTNSGNAAERRFIRPGMSEAEVVMRIGRPDVDSKSRGKAGKRWAYLPVAGDPNTLTTVTIAGGTVVDVERKVAR